MQRERHAEAAADMLLETGWSCETLERVDHLREARSPCVNSRPCLASHRGILGDGDDAREMGAARQRQRRADQTRGLRHAPADSAHPGFKDFADKNYCVARRQTLGKAPADRHR